MVKLYYQTAQFQSDAFESVAAEATRERFAKKLVRNPVIYTVPRKNGIECVIEFHEVATDALLRSQILFTV